MNESAGIILRYNYTCAKST